MTVSTCGLVPGILRLADSKVPVGLAVSLPTVREDLRKTLMPAAAEYSLDSLKEALDEYGKKTRKRPTVSVVIIRNVNDGGEDARSLADFLAGLRVLVNLIPYNKTNLHSFSEPEAGAIQTYYEILSAKNIPAVRRCPRGAAIGGACGQLGPVSRRHENLFEGAGRPIFR
jgi:23S rRNA (adenine2503-C2)-methyltransferase